MDTWTWVAPTYKSEDSEFGGQVVDTPSRWTGGASPSSPVSGLDPNNSQQMNDYYAAVASGQIKPQDFSTLFSNQDRMMSAGEFSLFSPEVQKWAKANPQQFMQQTLANRNSANQDLASVGAEGGYSLPQNITTGANGLDYSKAGYMNINDGGGFGDILPYAVLAAAAIYTGGAALGAWGAGAEAAGAGAGAGWVSAEGGAAYAGGMAADAAAAGTAAAAGDAAGAGWVSAEGGSGYAGAAAAAVPEEIASGGASLSGYTLPAAVDPAAATASKGLIDTALTGAGRSAAINGAVQLATTGNIDPGKLAISAAAGGFGGVLGSVIGDVTGMPFVGQVAGAVGGAVVGGALSGGGTAASGAVGGGTSTGGSGGSSGVPTVNPLNLSFSNPGIINRTAPQSMDWSTPRLNWSGA